MRAAEDDAQSLPRWSLTDLRQQAQSLCHMAQCSSLKYLLHEIYTRKVGYGRQPADLQL